MLNVLYSILGILIPFGGTSLGSSFTFFMKKNISDKLKKVIIGFAAGVMIAACVWSLIIPAVEMSDKQGVVSWLPATVGIILGIVFLIIINKIALIFENSGSGKKIDMLLFSVTLHNIPEGMAVRSLLCRIFSR